MKESIVCYINWLRGAHLVQFNLAPNLPIKFFMDLYASGAYVNLSQRLWSPNGPSELKLPLFWFNLTQTKLKGFESKWSATVKLNYQRRIQTKY